MGDTAWEVVAECVERLREPGPSWRGTCRVLLLGLHQQPAAPPDSLALVKQMMSEGEAGCIRAAPALHELLKQCPEYVVAAVTRKLT